MVDAVDETDTHLSVVVGHQDDVEEVLALRVQLPQPPVHSLQSLDGKVGPRAQTPQGLMPGVNSQGWGCGVGWDPVLGGEGLLAEIRASRVEAVPRCKACFSHLPGSLLSPLSLPLEPGGWEGSPRSLKQVPHHIHLRGCCP